MLRCTVAPLVTREDVWHRLAKSQYDLGNESTISFQKTTPINEQSSMQTRIMTIPSAKKYR